MEEALDSFDHTIEINPNYPTAHANRGITLKRLNRLNEAISSLDKAIELKNDNAEAYIERGDALQDLKHFEEALADYERALELSPEYPFLFGTIVHSKNSMCLWRDQSNDIETIKSGVHNDRPVSASFPLLALVDDPIIHLQTADKWVREKVQPNGKLGIISTKPRGGKLHIAYLSADFYNHATSYLMAELFELHDRDKFELTAISFGPQSTDEMRQRLINLFDQFTDVRGKSDEDVARFCREVGVDIAVDLKGFTKNSRPGILAERCAPIQISWLGYPGTMAAPFIDYIIADRTLITDHDLQFYTEKVIWMPDTYQVNDSKRSISDKVFTRAECDLPEKGFVFCCFNNSFKILPDTFRIWMRILNRVPGSVLWLLEDNEVAVKNLRVEAALSGINPNRLVFAKRLPLDEHLARHGIADLFIDTWPCNAHTTASDALWAGLPVLTKAGKHLRRGWRLVY